MGVEADEDWEMGSWGLWGGSILYGPVQQCSLVGKQEKCFWGAGHWKRHDRMEMREDTKRSMFL
jgi:hypothetical protein